jgi:UrcA family protein
MGTKKQTSPNLTTSNLITSIFAVALAVGSLALAPAAMAEPDTVRPVSAAVSYADLDLSTEDGANAVLQRINVAARDMCGGKPIHSPLFPRAATQFDSCVSQAVDSAVAGLDAPVVLAFHKAGASETPVTIALR